MNQELAGDVVLGVRSVLWPASGPHLGDADDAGAIDWVVEMRRFDEGRTMAALARRGALISGDAASVGRRLASFHARAPVVERPNAAEVTLEAWSRNLAELRAAAPADVVGSVEALRTFSQGLVRARRSDLNARAAAGLVREGHGDLRAEHVLVDGAITIVDRLEFDRALREIDVADDLAFLLMDLEALGVTWAAAALLAGYRDAGGESGDDQLLAFFGAYRASVRAKVELLRAEQLRVRDGAAETNWARGLLSLAEQLAWRARPPALIIVCGPPASGKSHLAAALATRIRADVLSSDAIRKERLGLAIDERATGDAYSDAQREGVYGELAQRVRALPSGAPAIVDATFGSRDFRRRIVAAVDDRHLRWVECEAPVATLVARAGRRVGRATGGSDAGPEVAARLASAFESLDEIDTAHRLRVDTTAPTAETLRAVGVWLDGRSAEDVLDRPARRRGPARAMSEAKQQLGVPRSIRDGGDTVA